MIGSWLLKRVFTPQAGARALALFIFAFLLNAFIQSGSIRTVEVAVGLGWLALCYVLSARCSVPRVLVPTFFACVAWGLFIESQPVSDWLLFHDHAQALSQGHFSSAFASKSFTTTLYGSVFHVLLGSGWVTNYIASALALTAGSAFVYAALLPFTSQRLAKFACFALALCPTFLVFSPVLGSKGVFFLVSAICAWLLSKHFHNRGRNLWLYPAGLGLATALLYLTRPHGVLLLGVCVLIVAAAGPALREIRSTTPRSVRNGVAAAAIVMAVAASVVLVHACLSYVSGQGFQLTADRSGWIVLMYGTNVASEGMWNRKDVDLYLLTEGSSSLAEMNRRARKVALERLTDDVPGLVKFAFTTKMKGLYGRDPKLFGRSHGRGERSDMLKAHVQQAAERVEMGVYRLVFLLFLALLLREIWRPSRLLILGIIVLLYSLPHLLWEVDQRYHMLMLPYFVVGSVLFVHELAATGKRKLRRHLARGNETSAPAS